MNTTNMLFKDCQIKLARIFLVSVIFSFFSLSLFANTDVDRSTLPSNSTASEVYQADDENYVSHKLQVKWDNAKDRLPYVLMSYLTDFSDNDSKDKIRDRVSYLHRLGYERKEKIENKKINLKASAYVNDLHNTIVIAISGEEVSKFNRVYCMATRAYMFQEEAIEPIQQLIEQIQQDEKYSDYSLEFTGIGHGAALAEIFAYRTNSAAFVFNAVPAFSDFVSEDLFYGVFQYFGLINYLPVIRHAYVDGSIVETKLKDVIDRRSSVSKYYKECKLILTQEEIDEMNNRFYQDVSNRIKYRLTCMARVKQRKESILLISEKRAGVNYI